MSILHITLKHVIRRFRTCNYFRKIVKFLDFMNALMIFGNCILSSINSLNLTFRETSNIFEISRSDALKLYISRPHSKFFLDSGKWPKSRPFRESCSLIQEIEIFLKYLNRILTSIKFPFQRCMILPSYFNRSQMSSGGYGGCFSFVFHSAQSCNCLAQYFVMWF